MEYEVKFLNIDPEAIQEKLAGIGAEKVGEFFYRRSVFDYPDWRLDKEASWLRLRDEGNQVTLTFKKRIGVKASDGSTQDEGMEELEVVVNDFAEMHNILLRLGFIEKHYVENRRIRWRKGDIEFDIDTYPAIATYLEIEGKSWEAVDGAIHELGLDPKDKNIFSANQVYALNGIQVADYTRLTFDELVKR
ncbi:MAG: class IV adenylate cyclase [Patescibacteria group bacterium]|jgi:adenylate cyclase class 2